ncbi:pilus assembly protein [Tessaracoccus sp. MC1756]|uniref:pilus assembly protein n=1 Tax=Tessaracoccus sp. MC1756 TaxID=2760311 RepID=UPI0016045BF7|nr:pilus assembly protein [Tessaracoccus sp. MC1756]MBB1510971.1 pilus assembly protein [Tessaracoccus sp. MC1756]
MNNTEISTFSSAPDERGMVSVWVAVALVAFIVIVGIGVDFAGHTAASQDARAIAAEAARAGGQHLTLDSGRARPDVHGAIRAASAYVAGSPYRGSTSVRGGDTVTVVVTGRYETQFLSIIGISGLPVNEAGSATVKSVMGSSEQ